MHPLGRYITLIICCLLSVVAQAQEGKGTSFSLTEAGNGYRVDFSLGDVTMQPLNDGFIAVEAEGMASLAPRAGLPALPQMSRLLLLPRGCRLTVESVDVERQFYGLAGLIVPDAGATVKDQPSPTAELDKGIYGADDWYTNGSSVEVEDLGTLGDRQLFRVTIHAVEYNPLSHSINLLTHITATLTLTPSSVIPRSSSLVGRLLIVSRPMFREGLQPFVRWKQQEGYEVTELYADTNKRDSIKALIAPFFANNEAPDYLLLVGDAAQIQAFIGTTHPAGMDNHVTDLYYAEHTGDYLPDAIIGRWPVNDTAELGAVVRKTLRYEQGCDLDPARTKRLLLVAGNESQTPAPVTTNGQVNYIGREVALEHPEIDTLCYRNPASADQRDAILNDLQQGAGLLNYTAHCTVAGWSSPSVSFGSIDTLNNPQPLLYVNNCCLSNAFTGTCFGEQLLRKPVGGAIGVIGATNSTLWNEDYYWAVGPKYPFSIDPVFDPTRLGAFDRLVGRAPEVRTQGELLVAGNLAVTAFGSPYDKFYWETYCLFGDPTLRPYVGVPQPIALHFANGTPHDGDGSIYLGGATGVTVTAMQHDTVLGAGMIGTNGLLTLDLNRSIDTTPLILTATAYGYRPYIDTVTVQNVIGLGVALREVTASDSVVTCRVENVGTQPLFGLCVVLGQLDADSTVDALVAEQQVVIDTLMPRQSHLVVLPVQVVAAGQYPFWQAQLFAWDSTEGMIVSITLQHTIAISYPEATFRLLENDSSTAHHLLPQHSYLFETIVDGMPDSMSLTLTALPTGDTLHTTFVTPDTLTHLHIEAMLKQGNYRKDYDYYLIGGHRMDSFEEGFDSYPWQQGGTQPWIIDSTLTRSGRFSARSGAIDHRQTSDLVIEVFLAQPDTLSYWFKTSCESQYDKFIFTIDGVQRGEAWWGESQWIQRTHNIAAGHHTLRWRYVKDDSGSAGSDCIWIDDVRLPLALWDSAYGWFGDTATLGIEDFEIQCPTISIYPNPTSGTVTIETLEAGTLRILDLYGREVYSLTALHSPLSTLYFGFLPDGIYMLQVTASHGAFNRKLIIQH